VKRILCALLCCLLLLSLTACFGGGDEPTTVPEPTPEQTTTAEPEIEYTTQVVEVMIDPDFDAQALFERLEGVWDDDYGIPGFMSFIYKDGKPSLYCGVYDGETNGVGTLIGGREGTSLEAIATLYFLYPASDDELSGPLPERFEELKIDLLDSNDGELRVKHTSIWGTREWRTLTYRCKTLREAGIRAIWQVEASAALQWNDDLLAELGMTYEELTDKYGPRTGQDGAAIRFENGPGSYSFADWSEQPALTDRCVYIVVPAQTLFLGLTGPVAKEDFLAALGIRDGEGYGPTLKDGYNHHTVMHFGDLDRYELSIWHNEKNAFRTDDLAAVLDPQIR